MDNRPTKVLISIVDAHWYLPYQWALLKTYAAEDPALESRVAWLDPLHLLIEEARDELEDELAFARKHGLKGIDVLGLSCYAWNAPLQLKIARIAKKVNPGCLVVAGGPEIRYKDPDFFRKHPYVDIIVKKDGEIPFRKILAELTAGGADYSTIPGLVVNHSGDAKDTGTGEVYKEFHRSPWLENRAFFEKLIKARVRKQQPISFVFETNRGCPYSCTYCNWGSSTMSKLRLFNLEHVRQEIEFFADFPIGLIWVADANFGIIPRDLEITRWFTGLGKTGQKPQVYVFAAKNNPDRITEIAIALHQAGMGSDYYMGIQTTDPMTLKAIGRSNMTFERHLAVGKTLREHGVNVKAQLIMGCPGETVASWRKTITDVLEMGITAIQFFPFTLLANTPADEPAYREKWKIETKPRTNNSGFTEDCISSTLTFTEADLVEMELFATIAIMINHLPRFRERFRDLHDRLRIPYSAVFGELYDRFFRDPAYAVAHRELGVLREFVLHQRANRSSETYQDRFGEHDDARVFFISRAEKAEKKLWSELERYLDYMLTRTSCA